MPLTREQTKYVPTNDTVFFPTVAIAGNLGTSGTSVFDGAVTFNGNVLFNPSTSITLSSTTTLLQNTTNLFVSGQASIGTTSQLAQLSIIPALSNRVGVLVRGAVGQSVDLFRVENSSSANLFSVSAFGAVNIGGSFTTTNGAIEGAAIVGNGNNYSAVGKYLAVSRFDTNFGFQGIVSRVINPNVEPFVMINSSNNPIFAINGQGEISSQNNNAVPLTIRGTPNTSSVSINVISGNGSTVTYGTQTTSANRFVVGSTVTVTGASTAGFNGTFIVTSVTQSDFSVANTTTGTSSTATATIVGQVGDLTQYKNPAGTIIGGINSVSQPYTGSTTTINTQVGGAVTGASHDGTAATITLTSASNLAVGDQIVVTGFNPSGYNGTHIITAVSNTTTFTVSYRIPNPGGVLANGIVSTPAQDSVIARSAGTIGQIIRGATSQVSDLQIWQSSAGATLARMDANGNIGAGSIVNTTARTSAYTLVAADANTLVQMNGAFAFTVPLNSTTPYPIGTNINLLAITAGVSVTFTGGITFYATPGRNLRAAGSMATLIKLGTDTWVLTGDLTA